MNPNLVSKASGEEDKSAEVIMLDVDNHTLFYEAADSHVVWRVHSMLEKEPDTICWIEQFKTGETFVDIGANIGLYTIYAAVMKQAVVYAFEPEAQNYALLNRNIMHNSLQDRVVAYCLALTDAVNVNKLYLSETGVGRSCHTFGESVDFNLKPRISPFAQGSITWSLDRLIEDNVIPIPDHIKIDVDGLEHLVLKGSKKVLANPKVKSILVEINTLLSEHQALFAQMSELGFIYCQDQVDVAVRKDGAFAGTGNFIFFRPENNFNFTSLRNTTMATVSPIKAAPASSWMDKNIVVQHMVSRCRKASLVDEPFPYFFIEDLFPDEYYQQLLDNKPNNSQLVLMSSSGRTQGGVFDDRLMLDMTEDEFLKLDAQRQSFWGHLNTVLLSQAFAESITRVFWKQLQVRGLVGKGKTLSINSEALFMRDRNGFRMGPHTDSPKRFISTMIYLPDNNEHSNLGTSIYRPKQQDFTCEGLVHHSYGSTDFEEHYRAPYIPNSCLVFLKTNNSFHGVEALPHDYLRDTICYTLKHAPA